jgi:hypothetical protein
VFNVIAVDWSLMHPGINDFKKFIISNEKRINLKGIILPRKNVSTIDNVPVVVVEDFKSIYENGDYIVCCTRDRTHTLETTSKIKSFGINILMLDEFISYIVGLDIGNDFNFKFVEIQSSDIHELIKQESVPFGFMETESLDVYKTLKYALSSGDWSVIYESEYRNTLHYCIFDILSQWLKTAGDKVSFQIDSNHSVYLEVILRLRALQFIHSKQLIEVVISEDNLFWSGWSAKKYERLLQNSLLKGTGEDCVIMRLGCDDFYLNNEVNTSGDCVTSIMYSSVVGVNKLAKKIGYEAKVSLRQPDNDYRNLIALFTHNRNQLDTTKLQSSFARPL